MSQRRSALSGQAATKTIVNYFSSGGLAPLSGMNGTTYANAKEVLSGALTANTLATVVSVTGSGQCSLLSAYAKDATSRTIRLQVIVDGQVTPAFDATCTAVTAANYGQFAAGQYNGSSLLPGMPIRFNASLVIKVASSLTETNLVGVSYAIG